MCKILDIIQMVIEKQLSVVTRKKLTKKCAKHKLSNSNAKFKEMDETICYKHFLVNFVTKRYLNSYVLSVVYLSKLLFLYTQTHNNIIRSILNRITHQNTCNKHKMNK